MSSVELHQFRAAESMKLWFQLRNVPYVRYIEPETSCPQDIGPLKGKFMLDALHGLGVQQSQRLGYQEKFKMFFYFRLS